jgi:hypothetical protein
MHETKIRLDKKLKILVRSNIFFHKMLLQADVKQWTSKSRMAVVGVRVGKNKKDLCMIIP